MKGINMNPTATTLMIFGTSVGYAFGDINGAAIGLAVTSGIISLVSLLSR